MKAPSIMIKISRVFKAACSQRSLVVVRWLEAGMKIWRCRRMTDYKPMISQAADFGRGVTESGVKFMWSDDEGTREERGGLIT